MKKLHFLLTKTLLFVSTKDKVMANHEIYSEKY